MKPHDEVKADLVRQWITKAEDDFLVAEHLLEVGSFSLSAVGFHAQQAAEKFLKAYLVHYQVNFPKTHDIDTLLDLTATIDQELSDTLCDASILTAFGVEARYPGDYPAVSQDEAAHALTVAAGVRKWVKQHLSLL